eukprot:UN0150
MGILLSQDSECQNPVNALGDRSGKSEATETSTSIEEDEDIVELAYLATQYGKDKKDQLTESLAQLQLTDVKHLEAGTRAAVGSGNFIVQVGKLVTFIILMIVWGLSCGLVYGFIMTALGVVLCILKTIIMSALRAYYGAEQEVLSGYGFCMSHWFRSIYRSDLQAGNGKFRKIGLPACALSNMPQLN